MAELWPGGPIELPHTFTIDDVELTLPEIPTMRLMHMLATGSWWELLPNSINAMSIWPLAYRLADDQDTFDFEHLWEPAITLFGRLAGTAGRNGGIGWWPAVRLAGSAVVEWPLFNAWCATHGLDPTTAPLWKTIGATYAWVRSTATPENLSKLEQEIWAPPPIVATAAAVDEVPQHIRDEEAALALAALRERLPGEEEFFAEWTNTPAS